MLEKTLVKLGLSDKEAKVYLALLELGQETVQHIAERAQVRRPTTYVILEKLLRLGLVSTINQERKTLFVAESPRELVNVLDHQVHEIQDRRSLLDETLGQLMARYRTKDKPIVRFFEGIDGLTTLDKYGQEKKVKEGKNEIFSIFPLDILERQFPERRKEAVTSRVKLGRQSRVIYTHKTGRIPDSVHKKELRTARFVPRDKLPIDTTISMYPDSVRIFYLNLDHPYGILIEDEGIVRNMRSIFELAWLGAGEIQP